MRDWPSLLVKFVHAVMLNEVRKILGVSGLTLTSSSIVPKFGIEDGLW